MSHYARIAARWVWFWMLWSIRRPALRRLERRLFGPVAARQRTSPAEKFARKHGLLVLTIAMNLLFGSLLLTLVFLVVTQLYISGALQLPDPEITRR